MRGLHILSNKVKHVMLLVVVLRCCIVFRNPESEGESIDKLKKNQIVGGAMWNKVSKDCVV